MGLSIHYRGQIKENALIDELISEAVDICKSLSWNHLIFEKTGNANDKAHVNDPGFINYSENDLKGISFVPEDCEPVSLVFFPSGRLCCPFKLMNNNPATNDLMVETISTKTQYAGMDVHITVLKLLQYFKDKYFSVFELSDEGNYWETKDAAVLKAQFDRYNFLVDTVHDALSSIKAVPGETPQSLADRIEEILKKKVVKERKK
ncbi:MAG: hypothetical protein IPH68_03265 [Chitinophagaceae bacterium]|nr:hypothetical protein [Chitinophagaceae bacterium]MBK9531957.1 hypothetical protein [Chitinophagaceae bacterium]